MNLNNKLNFEINKFIFNQYNSKINKYRVIGIDSSFKDNIGLLVYSEFLYNENNFNINVNEELINLNNDLSFNKEVFMLQKEIDLSMHLMNKYQEDKIFFTLIMLDGSIIESDNFNSLNKNVFCITYTSSPNHKDLANKFFIKDFIDKQILNNKLNYFEKTEWYKSIYNKNIEFYYLKTKLEISRIERKININNDNKINENNILEFILYNQIKKGFGYPLVLSYTHLQTQRIKNYFYLKNIFNKNFEIPKIKNIFK